MLSIQSRNPVSLEWLPYSNGFVAVTSLQSSQSLGGLDYPHFTETETED